MTQKAAWVRVRVGVRVGVRVRVRVGVRVGVGVKVRVGVGVRHPCHGDVSDRGHVLVGHGAQRAQKLLVELPVAAAPP